MKKIINLLSSAIVAIAFSACSDVPAPYDINNGTGGGDASTYVSESFSSGFGSFKVKTIKGTPWVIDYSTAKASGYDNDSKTNTESESYLVSKTIDLSQSTEAYIEFEYILRYASSGTNKVLITDNYTDDPETTTWTDITGKLTEGSDWNTFEIYLKNIPEEFIGKPAVNIAFYYYASSSNSATWEVKNVKVKEGAAEDNNGDAETPDDLTGEGTVENPYTVADAQSIIASGNIPTDKVYVKGIISEIQSIDTGTYGNAEYYISDDGTTTEQFLVYRGYGLGGEKFKTGNEIKVGDEVIVYGVLVNYNGTYEFTSGSQIYSLNGQTAGGGDDNTGSDTPADGKANITKDGTTVTMTNPNATASTTSVKCDLSTYGWENNSDPTKVTLDDGTTIVFAQEGGNNAPKYYTATNGVRMYALNSMTVTGSKNIASIVLECDTYQGTDYVGNEGLYASINGTAWKVVNDHTSNSGGTQLRIKTITITYAQDSSTGDNDNPGGNDDTPAEGKANIVKSGTTVTMTNPNATASTTSVKCDLSTYGWENNSDPTKVTLDDGTTIVFAQEGGNNAPKYYTATNGVRMYALNSMTVTGSKNIASIVLGCDNYQGTDYVGNEGLYASINGTAWKVVNDHTSNSGGTQLRVQTITITYAQ